MKQLFCNRCHKRIIPPKFLFNGNINAENGIKLSCGDPKCKGHVKYFPIKKD